MFNIEILYTPALIDAKLYEIFDLYGAENRGDYT